jgi:hypothetical protein
MTLRTTITHLLPLRSPLQSALWRVVARLSMRLLPAAPPAKK